MAVVKIVQVCLPIGHVADNCGWQLASCCFNCGFSVMHECKIRGTHSCVLVFGLNKGNFKVVGQSRGSRLNFGSNFLNNSHFYLIFWQQDEDLEELLIDSSDLRFGSKFLQTLPEDLEAKLDLIYIISRGQ